jgi:hypothetical protein
MISLLKQFKKQFLWKNVGIQNDLCSTLLQNVKRVPFKGIQWSKSIVRQLLSTATSSVSEVDQKMIRTHVGN